MTDRSGRRVARRLAAPLAGAAALALLALAAAGLPGPGAPRAEACAFTRSPHAYEADGGRGAYLEALEAASVNALFPGNIYFQLPAIETGTRGARSGGRAALPPTLLKAIAWVESNMTMAISGVAFNSSGPALVSFDCGHGIMQVTTGMIIPLGIDAPTRAQTSVATHFAYNVARGAALLAEKWNEAPENRPVAGTDTGSDPALIENWYYAVWGYNGFTGPGSRHSNHPADPGFGSWPRPAYRCNGDQSRTAYPYQELVWGCLARPPAIGGAPLWDAVDATLPDLTRPQFFEPLALAAFAFPFRAMDMPTPRPAHADPSPAVAPGAAARLLGAPRLSADTRSVSVRLDGTEEDAHATVTITNRGSGVLSWQALPGEPWVVVDPPAGVALGADVDCTGRGCDRAARLRITVNPTLLPGRHETGPIVLRAANADLPEITIELEVDADFEIGAPGTSRLH